METGAFTPDRIHQDLKFLGLILTDLPGVANDWLTMPEGERVSWSLDWDQQMGYLSLLDGEYRAGAMTSKQRTHYRTLRASLQTALVTIEQLGLQRPPVSLEW